MSTIQKCIHTLEKISLVTCSQDVLPLLERALKNVEPILKVNTEGVTPLLWQNYLDINRLHEDKPSIRLTIEDIQTNASGFYEDYIFFGLKKP